MYNCGFLQYFLAKIKKLAGYFSAKIKKLTGWIFDTFLINKKLRVKPNKLVTHTNLEFTTFMPKHLKTGITNLRN